MRFFMQIDLRTVHIEPLRQAYDHLERRFGSKPASRYQEASYDIQVVENLHYRPTWDPAQTLYDPELSKVRMRDWYALRDPRQFYYSSYTLTRARQQEAVESNFNFVETRGLADGLTADVRNQSSSLLVPLRHVAWGANQNNTLICGYGFGTTFTQPCMFYAMDQLGIAQYLSRLGLLLGDVDTLQVRKREWLESQTWQPLRCLVEDLMAVRDPVEVFVAQDFILDAFLYPIVYEQLVDQVLSARGASSVSMLTQFMGEWYAESRKWVDATVKTLVAESSDNRSVVRDWTLAWGPRVSAALLPVAEIVFDGKQARALIDSQVTAFSERVERAGIPR